MSRLSVFAILLVALILTSCGESPQKVNKLSGSTMGTTYHITMIGGKVGQEKVDSILIEVNQALSTYIDSSLISRFNQADTQLIVARSPYTDHFIENCKVAEQVFSLSDGNFDPTVMPLVNLWGFGYEGKKDFQMPDSSLVDSLVALVGWKNIEVKAEGDNVILLKSQKGAQVDFSAIAKGYGVDEVSDYLVDRGILNFMVEIGGEVRCSGKPAAERPSWTIGVTRPEEGAGARDFEALVSLSDQAMATSGNYRNYFEVEGVKVSHSINPNTGYPERNTLLSATILAPTCTMADALATACMIAGVDGAQNMINKMNNVEGLLIYGDKEGDFAQWRSKGFPEK